MPIQHRLLGLSKTYGAFTVSLNSSVLYIGIGEVLGGKVKLKASDDITIAAEEDSLTRDEGGTHEEPAISKPRRRWLLHIRWRRPRRRHAGLRLEASGGQDEHSADLTMATGGDLLIASGRDTTTTEFDSKRKGFLSEKSHDEIAVASELCATSLASRRPHLAAVVSGQVLQTDDFTHCELLCLRLALRYLGSA